MESARITRMLESIRCQELKQKIQRQNTSCCNSGVIKSATIVLPESTIEQARSDVNLWAVVFPGAEVINGPTVELELL